MYIESTLAARTVLEDEFLILTESTMTDLSPARDQ